MEQELITAFLHILAWPVFCVAMSFLAMGIGGYVKR